MTVQSETEPIVVDSVIDVDDRDEHPEDVENALPAWIEENRALWGEPVLLPEWDIDNESYRSKHGWKVRISQSSSVFLSQTLLTTLS